MRAPEFWWAERPGVAAALLSPAAAVWGAVTRSRMAGAAPAKVDIPVICVGNVVAGGAGKTPIAVDIAARLQVRGLAVHFLTRGYGGRAAGPLRVDPATHTFADVGDEALLLAARAPTWVARDRVRGARAAAKAGAQVVVMDDGFQNPSLAKDLSLVVIDGRRGFGNGRLIPAGPLRESIADALARAGGAVVMGDDARGVVSRIAAEAPGLSVLAARAVPGSEAADLAGGKVAAFAGIGDPAKFFDTLRGLGCDLVEAASFADHHPYSEAEIAGLRARAEAAGAHLVTTAKDAVRLPPGAANGVRVLTIAVEWENESALDALLGPFLGEPAQ